MFYPKDSQGIWEYDVNENIKTPLQRKLGEKNWHAVIITEELGLRASPRLRTANEYSAPPLGILLQIIVNICAKHQPQPQMVFESDPGAMVEALIRLTLI